MFCVNCTDYNNASDVKIGDNFVVIVSFKCLQPKCQRHYICTAKKCSIQLMLLTL